MSFSSLDVTFTTISSSDNIGGYRVCRLYFWIYGVCLMLHFWQHYIYFVHKPFPYGNVSLSIWKPELDLPYRQRQKPRSYCWCLQLPLCHNFAMQEPKPRKTCLAFWLLFDTYIIIKNVLVMKVFSVYRDQITGLVQKKYILFRVKSGNPSLARDETSYKDCFLL